jgi:RNA polymerase sigma factor (sigma-70 family)
VFPSTRETLLRQASAAHGQRGAALNTVAEIYWQPCVRYILVRWHTSRERAEDLVQGFFAALVEGNLLGRYNSDVGPFRPWLRTCLDRFVLKQTERDGAAKRGGKVSTVSLEWAATAASAELSPEELFRREWQRQMFALAARDLRAVCESSGRLVRFQIFETYDLADDVRPGYEELAARFNLPVTTITNHLAWARLELKRLLKIRINGLAPTERDRERELRSLLTGREQNK